MYTNIVAWMRGYLTALAKLRTKPITYSDFLDDMGTEIDSPADVGTLGRYLDEVCKYENRQGRPMLTVLLVSEETGRPSEGFYEMARQLRKYNGSSEQDETRFFQQELTAIYDTWV